MMKYFDGFIAGGYTFIVAFQGWMAITNMSNLWYLVNFALTLTAALMVRELDRKKYSA
jgi:hypothetical protein